MKKIIKHGLMILLGWIFVLIAIIGVFLPVLPTTPFLILALALFSKSSPKFHKLLLDNKWFGPGLKQWEMDKTLSRKTKYKATVLIIITFAVSIILLHARMNLQLMLAGIALLLLFFIWRINERKNISQHNFSKYYDKFKLLDTVDKKKVHIKACEYSLAVWDKYISTEKTLNYRDSIVFMKHEVVKDLPNKAFQAVIYDAPSEDVTELYLEPITALQDLDWEPPDHIQFAYYSIYNLHRKYIQESDIDDWLIINQCLSSVVNEEEWLYILKSLFK